jgi:hypothetical protein
MPKFRKKPVVIEAFRLGERGQPTPAPAWFGSPEPSSITDEGIIIHTLEGDHLARWGDWIIKSVKGEFYPCEPDIFEAAYDLVTSANIPAGDNSISLSRRILELENAIRKHRDQRGDDRCWMDDNDLYSVLPEGKDNHDTRLPPADVMLENCKRFIRCRHNPSEEPYMSDLERIGRLQAENARLSARADDAEGRIGNAMA